MAKALQLKPEELFARSYADRLILEKLTEIQSAVKLSDLVEKLQGSGLGLSAVRSLLASNPDRFAYADRRWVPAARIDGNGRPFAEMLRLQVNRFGGPMPLNLLVQEIALIHGMPEEGLGEKLLRVINTNPGLMVTDAGEVALADWVFDANDESVERALALNDLTMEAVEEVQKKLGKFDWRANGAIRKALEKVAPVSIKALGAAAWMALTDQDPRSILTYDWRTFNAELLSMDGYVYSSDGTLHAESEAKKWISAAVKLAEKLAPTIEVEDAAPIDVKAEDVAKVVAKLKDDQTVTATQLLEEMYEITPSVKTYPDDLQNMIDALKSTRGAWWVGADRFRKVDTAPDFVYSVPELFQYEQTDFRDEDGDLIDVQLSDDGLSTSLRKLLSHPLATDVLDEDILPAPKQMAEQLRLVLKPIHRELGTFPMCQFPTGWLDSEPAIQELIFIDPQGRELQVWANTEGRLLFNLIDWWYEQPVESGAVFSITRTGKPNVFDFAWLDQTDPVVYISTQRMEELREIQSRVDEMSTLDILKEVMSHWPKGADFLTILWEVNVVRRSQRRLIASLLSSYPCFYQRSGSPVWHYDAKKAELGVDKTKKKFILKK